MQASAQLWASDIETATHTNSVREKVDPVEAPSSEVSHSKTLGPVCGIDGMWAV